MACKFDMNGVCHALVCYSSAKCGAKSDDGINYKEGDGVMFDTRFTLTFKIDNAAFVEDKFAEVALTLNQIAKSVADGKDIGRIWDKNGNLIGEWYFE